MAMYIVRGAYDSGDEPYIQNIEVIKNNTDLYVNCKTHEAMITKFKIEPKLK